MRVGKGVDNGIRMRGGVEHVSSARATDVHMLDWSEGACSRSQCQVPQQEQCRRGGHRWHGMGWRICENDRSREWEGKRARASE